MRRSAFTGLPPWAPTATILICLTFAMGIGLFTATPFPQDDHFYYQQFIESLAAGKFDLTIPGFHGSDIFGLVVYLLTHSRLAQIEGLMFPALMVPILGYYAGKALYRDETSGLLLALIVAMMPFISFVLLRGWTGPGYWVWMLLTIIGARNKSWWTGITWALAILTKPFAVILLPLIVVLYAQKPQKKRRTPPLWLVPVCTAAVPVILYVTLQWMQAGQIFIGSHAEYGADALLQSPMRILLNLVHSLQILFSVHNYYYPDPALTGPGNMLHTTPLLVMLGLFGIFAPKTYFKEKLLPWALATGAAAGLLMNALLDHMDHFYMEASVLLLILAALPVLRKHPLWIPLVVATLHFQWFYFWLQYRVNFDLGWSFFLVPAVADLCCVLWYIQTRKAKAS